MIIHWYEGFRKLSKENVKCLRYAAVQCSTISTFKCINHYCNSTSNIYYSIYLWVNFIEKQSIFSNLPCCPSAESCFSVFFIHTAILTIFKITQKNTKTAIYDMGLCWWRWYYCNFCYKCWKLRKRRSSVISGH